MTLVAGAVAIGGVPDNPVVVGVQNDGGAAYSIGCNHRADIDITTTNTTTQLIAGVLNKIVRICAILIEASSAASVQFEEGSGTTCSSPVKWGGPFSLGPQAGFSFNSPVYNGLGTNTLSNGVCVATSGTAGQLSGWITYTQL